MIERPSKFFPGVEGLRAVAVLAVIVFHLGKWLPSGFVGVDIFFVVSGFVVAHSVASLPTQRFRDFALGFYARRLIRIAPALVACLLITILVSNLIVPKAWLSDANSLTGLAAFFGASNLMLILLSDGYWAPRADFNPFTHTWSLGVEEQFYLISPAVLFFWYSGRRRLAVVLITLMAAVSVGFVILTSPNTIAFYSLHTRFWELAVGVALCLTMSIWTPYVSNLSRAKCAIVSIFVAIGLIASLFIVEERAFPWPGALLPVAFTAVAIMLTVGAPWAPFSKLLSTMPMKAIGKGSYSLYLWHWPIIVFARWTTGINSAVEILAVVALTALFATGSYFIVEMPVRKSGAAKVTRKWLIVTSGIGAITFAGAVGASMSYFQSYISLSVTKNEAVWSPAAKLPISDSICSTHQTQVRAASITVLTLAPEGCSTNGKKLFVIGDSHAGAYKLMLESAVRRQGWHVELISKAGCPFLGLARPMTAESERCQSFSRSAIDRVIEQSRKGDVLFLPGLRVPRKLDQWGGTTPEIVTDRRDDAISEAASILKRFTHKGVSIVLEMPKPIFSAPPFRCSDWFNRMNPICSGGFEEQRAAQENYRQQAVKSLQALTDRVPGVSAWDPLPLLCQHDVCSAFNGGKPIFFDGDHLSAFGNTLLWWDFGMMLLAKASLQAQPQP